MVKSVSCLTLLTALALTTSVISTGYAVFYDDDNCQDNPGIAVSAENPGCLEEPGRGSIKFHGTGSPFFEQTSLVITPHDSCSCQSQCLGALVTGGEYDAAGCVKLPKGGYSYRFITSGCDPNNCVA